MFLTNPTIDELKALDLNTLIEMLVQQSRTYTRLHAIEGLSERFSACQETIMSIQAAIIAKKQALTRKIKKK
ncbi:MAG: hypothetical protein H7Y42_04625 [Chitinophagaceae bacterium]|nr:hypothetical protein [Chitinophagaceae bacterium]